MLTKRALKLSAMSVLWLCLCCKKDPPKPLTPECKAVCCYNDVGSVFAARLEGVSISSFGQYSINFKDPVIDINLINQTKYDKEVYFAVVCPLDEAAFNGFNAKRMNEVNYQTKQYRFWGNLYQDPVVIPFNPRTKMYVVKIDRIEKVQ